MVDGGIVGACPGVESGRRPRMRLPSAQLVAGGAPDRTHAFTVIEVLVATCIIAVLAAVVTPVFMRARGAAHRTTCVSNERQIGAACLLYAEDFDEHLPVANAFRPGFPSYHAYWYLVLEPYLRNSAVFACPGDSVPADLTLQGSPPSQFYRSTPPRVSYGYNVFLGGGSLPSTEGPGAALGEVVRPPAVVLLADVGTTAVEGAPPLSWPGRQVGGAMRTMLADATVSGVTDPSAAGPSAPAPRHNGRVAVLFADGHARSLSLEMFFTMPGRYAPGEANAGASPCLYPWCGCAVPL